MLDNGVRLRYYATMMNDKTAREWARLLKDAAPRVLAKYGRFSADMVADVVGAASVRLMQHPYDASKGAAPATYAYRLCLSAANDLHDSRSFRADKEGTAYDMNEAGRDADGEPTHVAPSDDSTDSGLACDDIKAIIAETLASLPTREADIGASMLADDSPETESTLAARYGITVNNVRVILCRVKSALREELAAAGYGC